MPLSLSSNTRNNGTWLSATYISQTGQKIKEIMAGPKHGCDAKKLNEMLREERGQLRQRRQTRVVPRRRREGPASVQGQVKVKGWEIVIRGEITSDDMAAAMGLVVGSPFCALAAKREKLLQQDVHEDESRLNYENSVRRGNAIVIVLHKEHGYAPHINVQSLQLSPSVRTEGPITICAFCPQPREWKEIILRRGKSPHQAVVKSEKDQSQAAMKNSFEDFYHAIVELIEKFCEERGQVQYKIPSKKALKEAYEKHHTEQGQLKREEFIKIGKEVIRRDSFTLGKATMDFIMYLFGAPLCALAAKRILPGLRWISDDVAIPLATSASVAYLIRTKQL
uniref:Uncharacterized protein n=1 Tax=Oryza nivara TaxID=4536 RepID=A0A0E0FYZ1_ORYNI